MGKQKAKRAGKKDKSARIAPEVAFKPGDFVNRELSWLEFNERVLKEGLTEDLPLLERLKFLAIVGSNLDEFFMVRVAGLMQSRAAGIRKPDPSGMTPIQQLAAIAQRTSKMVRDQHAGIDAVLTGLRVHGLRLLTPGEWSAEQRVFLKTHFTEHILPVLTPLAIQELDPCPLLQGLRLHVALLLGSTGEDQKEPRLVAIPVPGQFSRFITVPAEEGVALAAIEDVIAEFAAAQLSLDAVLARFSFRITRDADVAVQSDEASDLLSAIAEAVLDRRRRVAIRLEITANAPAAAKRWIRDWLGLRSDEVYETAGLLDTSALMEIALRPGFDDLKTEPWDPQPARDLLGHDDLWEAIQNQDILLCHPYERFDPVVRLIDEAADDPGVLAIKQTLYRTSGDSPIVRALERAASNGKEVSVLVELKARFDEARNIDWARRLEDAGCNVIYGLAGLKTHSKALLIVRREGGRIRRYAHLATGNYNDKTARLYSDTGILTADRDVTADVAGFFNLLTGQTDNVSWSHLAIAPTGIRQRFLELIDREIELSTPAAPGLIMAKVNSLQDRGICEALYRASVAGVRILLNVRGICCLRPGVKGLSETIEVRSIVDRFLEHARIFYFANGGREEVYMASADWMGRNLDKRVEILFPVIDKRLVRRCVKMLEIYFADNVKAYRMLPTGEYMPFRDGSKRVRAQEWLYRDAVAAAQGGDRAGQRFVPLTRPKD